LKVFKSGAGVG